MRIPSVNWILTLSLVLVVASVSGSLAAGQEQTNVTEPPGVADGELESPSSLLQAHTALLVEDGFSANGTANVTIVRQSVLLDVERTANRTVQANATEYRQSQRSVARAAVASATRVEKFWGNESVEIERQVENGETTYNVAEPKSDNRLSGTTLLRPYLRSANYSVTSTSSTSDERTVTGTSVKSIGGERRYTLTATEVHNQTRIENRLPGGATNASNFSATAIVDEDGRIHEFDATVDYTIQGTERTHTITFDLQELGVFNVSRPTWVDEIPSETDIVTGTDDGENTTRGNQSGQT